MLVNFAKMHGLGNDFVVIDQISQNVRLHTAHIKRIADRHLGIGCDQVLLIEPPIRPEADFFYRIYNADGKEVEQCGNGARCAARFFYDSGFTNRLHLNADCLAGPIDFILEPEDLVTVNMGLPRFHPSEIPFDTKTEALTYTLKVNDSDLEISAISMGNPHAVLQISDIEDCHVKKWGGKLVKHPQFPEGTNVEFMQIIDRKHIRLRVYERGVGETKACGSGAAAAVVAGIRLGLLDNEVQVSFSTGDLSIQWEGLGKAVYLKGPTRSIFIGRFLL